MRVWLYYRLSNDDDPEQNSLVNQRRICQEFASVQGYSIVGESSDDNVSGMKFNRRGLDELAAVVDAGKIDAPSAVTGTGSAESSISARVICGMGKKPVLPTVSMKRYWMQRCGSMPNPCESSLPKS